MRNREFHRLDDERSYVDGLSADGIAAQEFSTVIDVLIVPIKGKDVVVARRNVSNLERPVAHRKRRAERELDTAITRGYDHEGSPRDSGAIRDFTLESPAIALQQNVNRVAARADRQSSRKEVFRALSNTRNVR